MKLLQLLPYIEPGTEPVVIDMGFAVVGLTTCYDLRFPELFGYLSNRLNAEIILVPSAFTVPTGRAHWETLLRARAIENQCVLVAAAQSGEHNSHRTSYGHTMIVDSWGTKGSILLYMYVHIAYIYHICRES